MSNRLIPASIVSLAVRLPDRVVDNDELRRKYPEVVRSAEERILARVWRPGADGRSSRFDRAMAKYLGDPFLGCVERRWLAPGEQSIDLEEPAARSALEAAGMMPSDVDLLICSSFFPDQCDVGNAAFLAKRLGIGCPAWNLESACSSSLVAFETAAALVGSGCHHNALVVTSCNYSRIAPENDTLAWGNGDGAAAFVVAPVEAPAGLVAFHSISTNVTCGAVYCTVEPDGDGAHRLQMHTGEDGGRLLRETAEPFLKECVEGALKKADLDREEVDLFVFNTPTAWYSAFCADVLGIPESRSINAHPYCANVGPVLTMTNLFHAARQGRVAESKTILLYAVGSVSTASAAIVRFPALCLGR
jgi:3-oxoacyl-[acyl-carrier-protein] synthase-3